MYCTKLLSDFAEIIQNYEELTEDQKKEVAPKA